MERASFHVFCVFCACFMVLHPYMCLYGCILNYRSELLYPLFCYQDHLYSFFLVGVHSMNYFWAELGIEPSKNPRHNDYIIFCFFFMGWGSRIKVLVTSNSCSTIAQDHL